MHLTEYKGMEKDEVILVNSRDEVLGSIGKLEAHKQAHLHRAISVFIFNTKGEWLLQQRTPDKYHSRGLWSNACCSHPRPGENTADAAVRRLQEEMGIETELRFLFHFTYKAMLEDGLTEHEIDHVYWGITNELPVPDADEVATFRYMDYDHIQQDILAHPEQYTFWFKLIVEQVHQQINSLDK